MQTRVKTSLLIIVLSRDSNCMFIDYIMTQLATDKGCIYFIDLKTMPNTSILFRSMMNMYSPTIVKSVEIHYSTSLCHR